jgi:hypothetical protein
MAKRAQTKLATALQRAHEAARNSVVKSASLQRADRELLVKRGYLQGICKGWYLLARPEEEAGSSTTWYASFWGFLAVYLQDRFGPDYCLSAGSSIDLQTGVSRIPQQVIALTGRGGKMLLALPHRTSILVYEDPQNLPGVVEVVQGVRVMPLPTALCRMPPSLFENQPMTAEIALRGVKSIEDLARAILQTESPTLAGRFVGAYQFLGDHERASQLISTTQAAGLSFEPSNPFIRPSPVFRGTKRLASPYAGRIEALFKLLREPVLERFQSGLAGSVNGSLAYLQHVDAIYEHDAYNSLSIEGYRVTPELIEKIRSGSWNPEEDPQDRQQVAAMAAKGYLEAFRQVKRSVSRVLAGENSGRVFREDYSAWYRALFSESVRSGLLQAYHLAGHRNAPVFIRFSRHVPPPPEAVNDAMDALLDVLEGETEAIVRAVLGHWLFGFIHPYMDGNGRLARFLMNLMLASGGYPWTIIRTTRRKEYLDALELASAEHSISPFAQLIHEEMGVDWTREP